MRHLVHTTALTAALLAAPLAPAMAQDASLAPTFGMIDLRAGFTTDPASVFLLAGGNAQVTFTDTASGDRCTGFFANEPDFAITYTGDGTRPLSITSESGDDTVLLVNGPDGQWYCNDDTYWLDSAVTFPAPQNGAYQIWVGTYGNTGGTYPNATLGFSERPAFEPQILRSFFGRDDRLVLDPTQAPWNMVGLVEMQSGSCSGALIARDVVLTAGHCFTNVGEADNPPVRFRAGYANGVAVADVGVTGWHVPATWRSIEQDGMDFGFMFLAEPIGDRLGWMDIGPLTQADLAAYANGAGPDILQAGYSSDRPGVLTGNLDCPFVQLGPANSLEHECDTVTGDSGSPLFVQDGDGYRIIGVESHTNFLPNEEYDQNVATYIGAIVTEFQALGRGGAGATGIGAAPAPVLK